MVDSTGIFIAGGAQFGSPGDNQLTDPDMDGVYSITFRKPKLTSDHYIFTNGACTDFSCKEVMAGKPCADPNNFNDRFFPPVTADTVISTCFGQCSDSTTCEAPPTNVDVTFRVDMFGKAIAPTGVYLGANFDSWSGGLRMNDPDGDLVYEVTANLPPGNYLFKYINGTNWSEPEPIAATDTECTVSDGTNTNRQITVDGTSDVVLAASCFGTCAECTPHFDVTFQVNMAGQTVASTGVFIGAGFEGWAGGLELKDLDGDSIYSVKVPLELGRYEFKYINGAAWAQPEELDSTDVGCTVTNNSNTNRVIVVDTAHIVLDASCFGQCSAECGTSTTGLADLQKDQDIFSVSPNPAYGLAQLSFIGSEVNVKELRIIDLSGKEILAKEISAQTHQTEISTADWAPGIYFVVVKTGQKIGTQKLMIRK